MATTKLIMSSWAIEEVENSQPARVCDPDLLAATAAAAKTTKSNQIFTALWKKGSAGKNLVVGSPHHPCEMGQTADLCYSK